MLSHVEGLPFQAWVRGDPLLQVLVVREQSRIDLTVLKELIEKGSFVLSQWKYRTQGGSTFVNETWTSRIGMAVAVAVPTDRESAVTGFQRGTRAM